MSLIELAEREVAAPDTVEISLTDKIIEVKGPLGTLSEDLSHLPIEIRKKDVKIVLRAAWARKKEAALVGTAASLITNMIKGVTRGFTYKLKVVYAHFPITIKVDEKKKQMTIENFIGEKVPRKVKICGDTNIHVQGDEVIVKGTRIQDVSQTAANIENATKIKDKDQRVFLDGIYIYEKTEGAH